jgi:hypothetical protein
VARAVVLARNPGVVKGRRDQAENGLKIRYPFCPSAEKSGDAESSAI